MFEPLGADDPGHQGALFVARHRHDSRSFESLLDPVTDLEVVNEHEFYSDVFTINVLRTNETTESTLQLIY